MSRVPPPAPDEAGGAPPAGQRPARQSVRAAGRVGAGAGAEQQQAGPGQQDGPAEDPGVRAQRWVHSLQYGNPEKPNPFVGSSAQADGNDGAAPDAGGGAAASGAGAEAEPVRAPEAGARRGGATSRRSECLLPEGAAEHAQVRTSEDLRATTLEVASLISICCLFLESKLSQETSVLRTTPALSQRPHKATDNKQVFVTTN